MKHTASFDDFLKDVVNLNTTRLNLLDESFEAIKKFIRSSTYKAKISSYYRHGSWAHQTIIRPVDGRAFDADIVMFVQPVDGWDACDYINELARLFEGSSTYKDKVRRYSHCVTIEYAGERKMDIAPCVLGRVTEETVEVCNRITNAFEKSAPEDYTTWIRGKNTISGRNHLRKITRLLKYVRDTKETFTCPSFLFTTLLGSQLDASDKDSDAHALKDLPSALTTVMRRLDDWLQARPSIPFVSNPALLDENQATVWDDTKYQNFRAQMHRYRGWIDDALAEENDTESLKKWRRVFGDDFAKTKVVKEEASASDRALATLDDVDIARERGLSALPPEVAAPSWRRSPSWRVANVQMTATVAAWLSPYEHGRLLKRVASGDGLQPNQYLRFEARLLGGADMSGYRTEWRVTNTGPVARTSGKLRGGFVPSSPAHTRWEQLTYRGVHMVEAFVIRVSDEYQVAVSKPFYVVIE